MSSCSPGPSPTNITRADDLPSPGTAFFLVPLSRHLVHTSTSAATLSSESSESVAYLLDSAHSLISRPDLRCAQYICPFPLHRTKLVTWDGQCLSLMSSRNSSRRKSVCITKSAEPAELETRALPIAAGNVTATTCDGRNGNSEQNRNALARKVRVWESSYLTRFPSGLLLLGSSCRGSTAGPRPARPWRL